MRQPHRMLRDGEQYSFHANGQDWTAVWHSHTEPPPPGTPHGSAAVCVTPDSQVVLISQDHGNSWELPGGRPENDEDWRATLDREVSEEACATVDSAILLGFHQGTCLNGPEKGLVLVRALWRAEVTLGEWKPLHETTNRIVITPDTALSTINPPVDQLPSYRRMIHDGLTVT